MREGGKRWSFFSKSSTLPWGGAVLVEGVEVGVGQQLASVDARLDGAQPAEDAHLLHVAHDRRDLQSLQLGVHGVEAAHQVLQEELERLGEAEHGLAVDGEGGDLLAAVVHDLALVGRGVVGGNGGRGWAVAEGAVHELVHVGGEVVGGGAAHEVPGVSGQARVGHEERGRVTTQHGGHGDHGEAGRGDESRGWAGPGAGARGRADRRGGWQGRGPVQGGGRGRPGGVIYWRGRGHARAVVGVQLCGRGLHLFHANPGAVGRVQVEVVVGAAGMSLPAVAVVVIVVIVVVTRTVVFFRGSRLS